MYGVARLRENKILEFVEKLNELDTENVKPLSHPIEGENVFREDVVDEKRMLSHESALSNAKNTHSGYFVVDAVLEE